MTVLVSDSSVLIEFSKRLVLEEMFALEFQFAVPDLLFHEELLDLGQYSRLDLQTFGLMIESLDSEGMRAALAYQSKRPALSLVDSFSLALASNRGWALLTEDRAMQGVAQSEGVAHKDALWVVDRVYSAGVLSTAQVITVLAAMRSDPRCPVPRRLLTFRIRQLGA